MEKTIHNLSLLFVSTIVTLFFLEFMVRVFFPQNLYPYVYKDDPLVSYRLKENYRGVHKTPEFKVKVETNSDGLRDYEHPFKKEEGSYRILVIGDSFTFGEGVEMEESYPKVMEKLLNERGLGKRMEVLNASAFSWGPSEEYLYLKHYGSRYKPDMVILGYNVNSDIWQSRYGLFDADNDRLISTGTENANKRLNRFLKEIPGYLFVRERSELLAMLRRTASDFLDREINRAYSDIQLSFYKGKPNDDAIKGLRITEVLLKGFKELSERDGYRFVLLLIPAREQLDPVGFGYPEGSVTDNLNMYLKKVCDEMDIEVIDMLPRFKGLRKKPDELYYPKNGHWNKDAHGLAGGILAQGIESLLFPNRLIMHKAAD